MPGPVAAADVFSVVDVTPSYVTAFQTAKAAVPAALLWDASPAGDLVPPVVTRLSPAANAELAPSTPVRIEVRDDVALRKVVIHARFADLGLEEVVYRGNGFAPNYATFSTVTETADNGDQVFTFSIRRTPGWPSSPTIDVIPIDTGGNEAT